MALDAISSNDMLNFMIYEKLYGSPLKHTNSFHHDHSILDHPSLGGISCSSILPSRDDVMVPILQPPSCFHNTCENYGNERDSNLATQGRKKRRKRTRVCCKNKEEAETRRMSHIAVERNRRKQMNEHLHVLKSLMPHSYAQKGDQASIVGGAIEYVKELEYIYQSLQAKKFTLLNQGGGGEPNTITATTATTLAGKENSTLPFAEFSSHPKYNSKALPKKKYNSNAEIEVSLMESHANLRILSRRRPCQLSKLIAGLHSLHFSVLHLSVTSMDTLILYSINAKVEEGCQLTSVDEIAEAVNHMLTSIEEEATLC